MFDTVFTFDTVITFYTIFNIFQSSWIFTMTENFDVMACQIFFKISAYFNNKFLQCGSEKNNQKIIILCQFCLVIQQQTQVKIYKKKFKY